MKLRNVYDYIEEMRTKPGMYSPDLSLAPLEKLLWGYCACLNSHKIIETYEGRKFDPTEFSAWLYDEKGWSASLGFSKAIEEHFSDADAAFNKFFKLVQDYRFGTVPD